MDRKTITTLFLVAVLLTNSAVQAQDGFLDSAASGRQLLATIGTPSIFNTVKAGASNVDIHLRFQITGAASADDMPLTISSPTGFTAAANCKGSYAQSGQTDELPSTGCVGAGTSATFTVQAKPMHASRFYVASVKYLSVPSAQPVTGNFGLTYDSQTLSFPVASVIQAVKGGTGANAAGGDLQWALMRPVNHTAKIENNIKFIFELTTPISDSGDSVVITLPVNYTLVKDKECAAIKFRTCVSATCTAKTDKTDYDCSSSTTARAIKLTTKNTSFTSKVLEVSFNATAPAEKQKSAGQAIIVTCRGSTGCGVGALNDFAEYTAAATSLDYGKTKADVRVNSARSMSVGVAAISALLVSFMACM
eukprot:Filipodium_phascolosomae@DN2675_c0_g1_i1.p1